MSKIPPQRHRGISHRAYHKKLVAFENPREEQGCTRRGRRRPARFLLSPFRMGEELEVETVHLKRVKRKPVHYFATNDAMVNCVLAKQPKGQRGWDVLLPKGGFHSFKTMREACDFIDRLRPLSEAPDA